MKELWKRRWSKVQSPDKALSLLNRQCKAMGDDWSIVIYWNQVVGWEVALYRVGGTAEMSRCTNKSLVQATMGAACAVLDDPISGVID